MTYLQSLIKQNKATNFNVRVEVAPLTWNNTGKRIHNYQWQTTFPRKIRNSDINIDEDSSLVGCHLLLTHSYQYVVGVKSHLQGQAVHFLDYLILNMEAWLCLKTPVTTYGWQGATSQKALVFQFPQFMVSNKSK